jgi:hypothetical protein
MRRLAVFGVLLLLASPAHAQVLDRQKLLDSQTFWDNRDWDWYRKNIPFFDSPDAAVNTVYYYRWELVTKHLTYGSPNSGYSFTEFIDRPFWSGTYGAISCPAGHQLYEVRWLRDPRYARDYARYWFHTPGAQPRNYSTWLADAVWAVQRVHPDDDFTKSLLPGLLRNYEGWEKRHFDKDVGLFWQTGHDDGMEFNINSRQTKDIVRGAPGYRPTLNAYLWADALAVARTADLAGDRKTAEFYRKKAAGLKATMQKKLWDPRRNFFFPVAKRDEERDGHKVKALSLTYQTGKYAGSPHGREEIGFVPWQFGMPDAGYESAWKCLTNPRYFAAPFGPTTVERNDPLFYLSKTCCWWSGQSWPYATTQTLKAMANLLHDYKQDAVTKADYFKLLKTYTKTQHKQGRPYIAEAAHPDTGSWDGHDSYNHSEHYFHSGYVDLLVTGLVGLRPRDDATLEVSPLAPDDWAYFALDSVPYRGRLVSVVWDRDGTRYNLGKGLHLLADGKKIATSANLGRLTAKLPPLRRSPKPPPTTANYAVNNDGGYYPRVSASHLNPATPLSKLTDGNYWYHLSPPNRWTCEGSARETDWVVLDFGVKRRIDTVKLYLLDDGEKVAPPEQMDLQSWNGKAWKTIPEQTRTPKRPTGRRANVLHFPVRETAKIRVVFTHRGKSRTGLTEIEAWGETKLPVAPAPVPAGNLAYNAGDRPFPKASASYTSRFDSVTRVNDGRIVFLATPNNRWTSYESPNAADWVMIDFGSEKTVGRAELTIYDDRGGVQAPQKYAVQFWDGKHWRDVADAVKVPPRPVGGQMNEVRFARVKTTKMRVVFTHRGQSRSGMTELLLWPE